MQQSISEEQVTYDDLSVKDMKKAERMLRSQAARTRRRELKQVREMKVVNEWARARRERKSK